MGAPTTAGLPTAAPRRSRPGLMTVPNWAFFTIFTSRRAKPTCARGSTNSHPQIWMLGLFLQTKLANLEGVIMKGDFTRDSFDPTRDFTRVMMQQGRPQLDADWNEQVAIFWQFWRNFISDVVGPHAGPERNCGFGILAEGDFPLPQEAGMTQQEQERLQQKLQGSGDFLIGGG